MVKVRVYKINKAVEERNNGERQLVGTSDLAIIVNGGRAIISEFDACHCVKDLPETYKMGIADKKPNSVPMFPDTFIYPTVQWILDNIESEEVDLAEWIIYYNIKDRIIRNCALLRESFKEIGLDPKDYFPIK